MPLNPQFSPFPPITLPDRGWAENIRAALRYLVPGVGIRTNMVLDLPLSGGQPTTGLLPTLTDGTMIAGDSVLEVSKFNVLAATKNWTGKKLYFGLAGMYYGDTPTKSTDTAIAQLSTDNDPATPSILTIAQPMSYGGGVFGVRGTINLAKCVKGADVDLFTWVKPADLGLPGLRITYAQVKTAIACTTGNAAGDDFVLKVGSTAVVTHAAANLSIAGAVSAGLPVSATPWAFESNSLTFRYNQVDAAANLAGGKIDFLVKFEAY
jgi:hypothetical protein